MVRPQIDEEKLMQIRAREKLRIQEEKSASKKKVSMAQMQTKKAFAKLRSDIGIKIKGAEKNAKSLFSEFKNIIDKTDSD